MEKITDAFSNLSQCPGCSFCRAPKGEMKGLRGTPQGYIFQQNSSQMNNSNSAANTFFAFYPLWDL